VIFTRQKEEEKNRKSMTNGKLRTELDCHLDDSSSLTLSHTHTHNCTFSILTLFVSIVCIHTSGNLNKQKYIGPFHKVNRI
jgi:hypothetical protein